MQVTRLTIKRYIFKFSIFSLLLMLLVFHSSKLKAQCCDFTISMHDSYGDGWNGGNLQVYVNSNSVGIFSAQLYGNYVTFKACTADIIELIYSPGDYENENSYEVFNQNGTFCLMMVQILW
jgi:hypothetical protein